METEPVDGILATLTQWKNGFDNGNAEQVTSCLADDFLWFSDAVVLSRSLFTVVLVEFDFIRTFRFDWSEVELWIQEDEAIAAPIGLSPSSRVAIGLMRTGEEWKISRLFMFIRAPS